jgi:hypothetical protein
MTAPAPAPAPAPVGIAVNADAAANRVIYQFGNESYGLTIEDAVILVNHTLHAIEILRPALGGVQ